MGGASIGAGRVISPHFFYTVGVRGYINSLQLFNNTTYLQSCNVVFPALRHSTAIITARCTLVHSAVLRSHVVCLSVCQSVTLVDCDHIGWNTSEIISPLLSLGCSLFATPTWQVCSKRNTPKFGPKVTHPLLISASETFDRKLRPYGYR